MEKTLDKKEFRKYRWESIHNLLRYIRLTPSMIIGIIIVGFYAALTLLDIFYPEYLGVTNAGTLLSFANISKLSTAQPLPPSLNAGWQYILGTTSYGLPIVPVMFASIGTDVKFAFVVVVISALVGTFAGAFSATYSRRVDLIFMRFTDVFLSFPAIIVVIIYSSIRGWDYTNISIGIMIIWWTIYARVARSAALPLKQSAFVEAAIASGCSRLQLMRRHVFPNILSFIFVQMTLDVGMVISIFATVNFVFSSLNVSNAFVPEIGNMIVGFPEAGVIINFLVYEGNPISSTIMLVSGIWWPVVMPGLFLILFIIGINLFGNGIRDYIKPRNR